MKVCGSIKTCAFPTGFGPGVCATFHRILDMRCVCMVRCFFV